MLYVWRNNSFMEYFNATIVKLSLKLGRGWLITSNNFMQLQMQCLKWVPAYVRDEYSQILASFGSLVCVFWFKATVLSIGGTRAHGWTLATANIENSTTPMTHIIAESMNTCCHSRRKPWRKGKTGVNVRPSNFCLNRQET